MNEPEDGDAQAPYLVDEPALLRHLGAGDLDELVEILDEEVDAYVSLHWSVDGLVLEMTTPNGVHSSYLQLTFPMSEKDFWESVYALEREVMGE